MGDVDPSEIEAALTAAATGAFAPLQSLFNSPFWYQLSDLTSEAGRVANALNDCGDINLMAVIRNLPETEEQKELQATEIFIWAVLPDLDASADQVSDFIDNMVATGKLPKEDKWYSDAFFTWCRKQPSRPAALADLILGDISRPGYGIFASLIVGIEADTDQFISRGLKALDDPRPNVREAAIRTLGAIKVALPERLSVAIDALVGVVSSRGSANEIGHAFTSVMLLLSKHHFIGAGIIEECLAASEENIPAEMLRNLSAHALFREADGLPKPVAAKLLQWLEGITPAEEGTLNLLDHLFYRFVNSGRLPEIEKLLENLLTRYPEISLTRFKSFLSAIWENQDQLSRLIFDWFRTGNLDLCRAAGKAISHHPDGIFRMSFDMTAGRATAADRRMVCRRAMGNILHQPAACASILITAMHGADGDTLSEIGQWFLTPMLMNFPGELTPYLEECRARETGEIADLLAHILKTFEEYQQDLLALGVVKEFEQSNGHFAMDIDQRNAEMEEAEENAEYKSPLLDLFPPRIILFGGKPIVHVYGSRGAKPTRTIMPLHTFSASYEFPRISALDPVGQSHQLFQFLVRGDDR